MSHQEMVSRNLIYIFITFVIDKAKQDLVQLQIIIIQLTTLKRNILQWYILSVVLFPKITIIVELEFLAFVSDYYWFFYWAAIIFQTRASVIDIVFYRLLNMDFGNNERLEALLTLLKKWASPKHNAVEDSLLLYIAPNTFIFLQNLKCKLFNPDHSLEVPLRPAQAFIISLYVPLNFLRAKIILFYSSIFA